MISVIIPCKNEENIHKVVDGVEQLFPGSQILIASDRLGNGKGWAVRMGLKHATGDIIVFLDGDGDIHPRMINRLLPHLDEFDIVVGKKDLRGFLSRRIITILSRLYIRLMFGLKCDTQTGIKAFKRAALLDWETNGFAFDIEILAKAHYSGFSMYEVTVDAEIVRKMKVKSIINTLFETFKIWRNVHVEL
jgi:glycosyltransferase involved in cell wall biosynthesis